MAPANRGRSQHFPFAIRGSEAGLLSRSPSRAKMMIREKEPADRLAVDDHSARDHCETIPEVVLMKGDTVHRFEASAGRLDSLGQENVNLVIGDTGAGRMEP